MSTLFDDPHYWNGSLAIWDPGSIPVPYNDYPINELKTKYIMSLLPRGKRVLDVGCANGFMVNRLRQAGAEAYGIDISHYALSKASAIVRPYLVYGTATHLPFPEYFDLVISFGTLEHLNLDDIQTTIKEMCRVSQKGFVTVTTKEHRGIENDPTHKTIQGISEWQAMMPPKIEVMMDDNEQWLKVASPPKVLIISTQIFPCGGDQRYQGIERLVYLIAEGLLAKGTEVHVAAPTGSRFPQGIRHIDTGPTGDFVAGELRAYGTYRHILGYFDNILDFSHSHWAMREWNLPAMCWVWHDPEHMQPPLPEYNVLALSDWQRMMLYAFQKVNARVFDCHCGYVPEFEIVSSRNNFLFIGRAHPSKGMLEAVEICRELGVGLDIIGGIGPNDDRSYLDKVLAKCRDKIFYWGQATDIVKDSFLRSAQAVLHPLQYSEAHSHKCVDALLYGIPVVSYARGAIHEVIEHGIDGFIAADRGDFERYMGQVDMLDRGLIKKRAVERWSVPRIIDRAIPLMKEVYRGLRW